MSDQREHYGDAPPAWATAPVQDPTGLRPCDRAHLAGWIGVFIALILAGIGLGYGGVLRGAPTAGNVVVLALCAAAVCGYGFAGLYLIFQTLTDRQPTGALVLLCNVMVVGPFVVPGILVFLGICPGVLIGLIAGYPEAEFTFWIMVSTFTAANAFEGYFLWREGRKLLRFLRAWLDPTLGQWW